MPSSLPERAHLAYLKKQAKELLRLARGGDPAALARLAALPRPTGADGPRLHDAQYCLAREYGFRSWLDLATHVEARSAAQDDRAARVGHWIALVYGADVTGTWHPTRPRLAEQILRDAPDIVGEDPYLACAAGDATLLRRTTETDAAWVHRPGGPLALPPLVAVTHSQLAQLPEARERLHLCVLHLLKAGADPNQRISSRLPPASLAAPDEAVPLSALYGAAGVNRDPAHTALLLEAGADPNDGESLYHSLEVPACTELLLRHGARVNGSNALRRALDMMDAASLELLLANGGDPNETASGPPTSHWGAPLLRAIALRRSVRHIAALLAAGADPRARTPDGIGAHSLALQVGLSEVADLVRRAAGGADAPTDEEAFVAACARADAGAARSIQARRPDLPRSLPAAQLRLLPDTVAWGSAAVARVMVELGWPLDARGGDWDASALNHAVARGDAALTEFLLAHGASWRDRHGFGDNAIGPLSFASRNEPDSGDFVGCARALLAHGMPAATRDPDDPETLLIDGRKASFSEEVMDVLLGVEPAASSPQSI